MGIPMTCRSRGLLVFRWLLMGTFCLVVAPTEIVLELRSVSDHFYSTVMIGNPPQSVDLEMDTVHALTVVPGAKCQSCGSHVKNQYNFADSRTADRIPCNATICGKAPKSSSTLTSLAPTCSEMVPADCGFQRDASSRYSGALLMDEFYFNETTTVQGIVFGRILEESGLFPSPLDGLLGLGQNDLAAMNVPNMIDVLADRKLISSAAFSFCFGDRHGHLEFGSDDSTYTVSTPYNSLASGYVVTASHFSVGDDIIWDSPFQVRINSGHKISRLPSAMWTRLVERMREDYCDLPGVCTSQNVFNGFQLSLDTPLLDMWPELHVSFGADQGVLSFNVSAIFFLDIDVLHFAVEENVESDYLELGTGLLRSYLVAVDRTNELVQFAKPNRTECGEMSFQLPAEGSAKQKVTLTIVVVSASAGVLLFSLALAFFLRNRIGDATTPTYSSLQNGSPSPVASPVV